MDSKIMKKCPYFGRRYSKRGAQFLSNKSVVIWFTGLSGSGKTTIAHRLYLALKKNKKIRVEFIDGDIFRENFTKDLGFSFKDRNENIRRVGYLVELLSRHDIITIASFISPYKKQREYLRQKIGNFIEVYVNTPLEICEYRDTKGLYSKARKGDIKNFTGVSDPYECPEKPEITICGDCKNNEQIDILVDLILVYLLKNKYIK